MSLNFRTPQRFVFLTNQLDRLQPMEASRKFPPANRPPPDSSQSNWSPCEGVVSWERPEWPAYCRWLWSRLECKARWPATLPAIARRMVLRRSMCPTMFDCQVLRHVLRLKFETVQISYLPLSGELKLGRLPQSIGVVLGIMEYWGWYGRVCWRLYVMLWLSDHSYAGMCGAWTTVWCLTHQAYAVRDRRLGKDGRVSWLHRMHRP